MNKAVLACIGTGVVTGVAGAVAGYFYAKGQLEHEYNQRFDEEMAEALESYDIRNKTGRYEDLESVAADRLPKREPKAPVDVALMDPRPYERPDVTDEQLKQTVEHLKKYNPEPHMPEGWEEAVVKTEDENDTTTDRDHPYVISVEVFKAREKGYDQPQLYYYATDKVLVDSDGDVVDIDAMVGGIDTLTKFGQGSNEIDFLYVRNDNLSADYEIERFHDSYASR